MQIHRQSTTTWQDVGAFLSLAAAAGLACGIALGGIALLLSAPAYGAGAEPVGILVLRPLKAELDPETAIRVLPDSTEAGFRIGEDVAEAHIVLTFRNPGSASYDGVYAMTLPQDVVVERLRVRVGGRIVDFDVDEAITGNVLAVQIKHIRPLQTVVIEMQYAGPLRRDTNADATLGLRRPVSIAL